MKQKIPNLRLVLDWFENIRKVESEINRKVIIQMEEYYNFIIKPGGKTIIITKPPKYERLKKHRIIIPIIA